MSLHAYMSYTHITGFFAEHIVQYLFPEGRYGADKHCATLFCHANTTLLDFTDKPKDFR